MIIDYSGSTPLSTVAASIASAYANGAWTGTGITSSNANVGTRAVGFADVASASLSIASFGGLSFDQTSVLVGFTRYGDTNLDGLTDLSDFARHAANFNTPGLWEKGDCDYNGVVDIGDFALLASNFNAQPVLLRGTGVLPPLAELYIGLLDHPAIYWEARMRPDIWWRFEEFERMNLGAIPPIPAYLASRGVPEPASTAVALGIAVMLPYRRRF